ncbi:MAG: sigma-70 family RNA polymerase sigma factor, partial [Planctomycetota bacterium]
MDLTQTTPPAAFDPGDEPGLLSAIKAGDPRAFERPVNETGPRMLAVARRMLPEADAQDAVQDAFVSALRALPGFDGRSKLSTWLHRIVVNACLMKLRKQTRRGERSIEEMMPDFTSWG